MSTSTIDQQNPFKKQKIISQPPPPPENPPPAPPPPPENDLLVKRRNKIEIKNLYDSYNQIKTCLATENISGFEHAYLSLITASTSCSSVQRIVADLIPRYASYCPNALQAAAKVTINMHNCSLVVISRGEDINDHAFGTAKACIFGLVDICRTASSLAPTSTVIQGVYAEVFVNVLEFLLSCLEGRDIFQIVDLELLMIQESAKFFSELKQQSSSIEESSLVKLSKICAMCLMRIFFCYPRNLLAACFELFHPTKQGAAEKGLAFLNQVTSMSVPEDVSHSIVSHCQPKSSLAEPEAMVEVCDGFRSGQASCGSEVTTDGTRVTKNCLLGLVLSKEPSLRSLISSEYKNLCKIASSEVVSEVTSVFERVFKPFSDLLKLEDSQGSSEKDDSDPSRISNGQTSIPGHNMHEALPEVSPRECTSKTHGGYDKKLAGSFPGPFLKRHNSSIALETDFSNASPSYDSGGSKSANVDPGNRGNFPHRRSSTSTEFLNNQMPSPVSRKPLDFRSNSFDRRARFNLVEQNQAHNTDHTLSVSQSFPGNFNIGPGSPGPMGDHIQWYSDGDPGAMDIFSACNQLWVGSLGLNASESLVREQFEKFGPVEQIMHFPYKDFALVEYKYLMDALRARRNMHGQSPWGACLRIKFLDRGLGSKGFSNNVTIGSSCQVYVGNILNRHTKDEILQDLAKVFHKGPRMVTDLSSESALLLEFDTPEEASRVMAHLRQRRKNMSHSPLSHVPPANPDVSRPMDISPRRASFRDDPKRNDFVHNSVASPCTQTMVDTRTSHLASLLSSLRAKYNITHSSNMKREEDHSPTSTLWIKLPGNNSQSPTDDELKAVCDLSIGSLGSVVKVSRADMYMAPGWFVECSNVDSAKALLRNLQDCPSTFFQIEFSQSRMHHSAPPVATPQTNTVAASTSHQENRDSIQQSGPTYQSNYAGFTSLGTPEIGPRRADGYNYSIGANPVNGGTHVMSGATEQSWMYKRPDHELHPGAGHNPCIPSHPQGSVIPPPPPPRPFQSTPFIQPVYYPQYSSWDGRGYSNHHPYSVPNIPHGNAVPSTFHPTSVTPLSQTGGSSFHNTGHIYPPLPGGLAPLAPPPPPQPGMPHIPPQPLAPPQPAMPPPFPSHTPPFPMSQPPLAPPPLPSSPPPQPPSPPPRPQAPVESFHEEGSKLHSEYQWQGALSKSGAHYCTIFAQRVELESCKYSNVVSEPSEWPAKLDMTKRTDFRHVKSTFNSTPPHRREVCWLFPSSDADRKGFQDFTMYLKQRECAGVFKIPATKSSWARLLFILPCSEDVSSLLSINPNSTECLVALVLSKETNVTPDYA